MSCCFTGLIAAAHTPFHQDGSLNLSAIDQQAEMFLANPISGAFICGTTGEGKSLSMDERIQVTERWLKAVNGKLPIIVHVGNDSLGECRKLAQHAQANNATAMAAIGPTFFKPADIHELVSYCAQIAEVAPQLPFYYYHIPSMTGLHFSMLEFLNLASEKIANLAGIKYTYHDLSELSQCIRFQNGRYNILFGRDEMLIAALLFDAQGAVGSTYNYAAPLYHQLIQAFKNGDLTKAKDLQILSQKLVRIVQNYNEIAAGKAILTMLGIDCGPVRPPLTNLTADDHKQLSLAVCETINISYLNSYR